MTQTNIKILKTLIFHKKDETLKDIRDGFRKALKDDEMLPEDKEICFIIDCYFKCKPDILELIYEQKESCSFDFDIFTVNVFIEQDEITNYEIHLNYEE